MILSRVDNASNDVKIWCNKEIFNLKNGKKYIRYHRFYDEDS